MILSIETAIESCSVALHEKGQLVDTILNDTTRSAASLLTQMTADLLDKTKVARSSLLAVAISAGPGSYTGLRIGLASAKGMCFGLGIPLIAIGTMDILVEQVTAYSKAANARIIPMIDARRMEVYAQIFDSHGPLTAVSPYIIDNKSFQEHAGREVWLVGNGATKCREVVNLQGLKIMDEIKPEAKAMGKLAYQAFQEEDFQDVAYFEPNYLKEFQTKPAKKLFAS